MDCYEPVLHIRTCSHLRSRAEQHTDFAASDLAEQLFFLCIGGRFVNKAYLLRRDTTGYQFLPHIVIDIESTVIFRGGQVAEHKLCRFGIGVFLPDTVHIIHAGIDFTVWVIWQHRVNHSLVKSQFPPVIGYLEHIVDVRLDKPCPDFLSPLRKGSYHFGLYLARLGLNIVVIDLWHGEF